WPSSGAERYWPSPRRAERTVIPGPPLRVEYSLSQMGAELEPALVELQAWANRWLSRHRETVRA
ncbi:MAG: winged helix-turn-helix transcriptional regulator, partial [Solirubrobacteraceae bacterium]